MNAQEQAGEPGVPCRYSLYLPFCLRLMTDSDNLQDSQFRQSHSGGFYPAGLFLTGIGNHRNRKQDRRAHRKSKGGKRRKKAEKGRKGGNGVEKWR